MKMYRAKLKALLDEFPDDEDEAIVESQDSKESESKGEGDNPPENAPKGKESGNSDVPKGEGGENKMEPSTVEKTDVQAPQIPAKTSVTAEEMERENLEKQIAAFYLTVNEQKTAINLLIERVAKLEQMIITFDKAIDVAAKTDIRAVSIDEAVNLL